MELTKTLTTSTIAIYCYYLTQKLTLIFTTVAVKIKFSCVVLLRCRIQRYSVIPLSTNSGLIGWVPNCDTLHSLIRDYREKKKILLNLEHRIMLRV